MPVFRRAVLLLLVLCVVMSSRLAAQEPRQDPRPSVGLALGGGSARGLAHVGVLAWLEEHRIPVDHLAGTSVGGLVGGMYATGRTAGEVSSTIAEIDWDSLFLTDVPFGRKTLRRKEDRRAYPMLVELGLRGGIGLAGGLASDHTVGLMLSRLALPYPDTLDFDDLPIPFRAVATDLERAESVELGRGSLSRAMRATMAIPGVFAPIDLDGRLLADGGLLNNVPADVVRRMGADVVIAVDVSAPLVDRSELGSLIGFANQAIGVMMVERTRQTLATADVVISPETADIASSDWRRHDEIFQRGYAAADAQAARLLPLALDEEAWARYQAERDQARRRGQVTPAFVSVAGVPVEAARKIEDQLGGLVGEPIAPDRVDVELTSIAGAGRYESLAYQVTIEGANPGIRVNVQEKTHGPPFLNLAFELANQADSIDFGFAGRVTAYDIGRDDAEARLDFALGSSLGAGGEYLRPLGETPLFVAPRGWYAAVLTNFVRDGDPVATFRTRRTGTGVDVGLFVGPRSEIRAGYDLAYVDAGLRVGDPLLPTVEGREQAVGLGWSYDGQDHWIVPSSGIRVRASTRWLFDVPDQSDDLRQASISVSQFLRPGGRDRLFVTVEGNTSFDHEPSPFYQFTLGGPLRLGAFDVDEFRGAHSALLTAGYLRQIGRLPDFVGGPVYFAGWAEGGSAFDDIDDARLRVSLSGGLFVETFLGPVLIGGSVGDGGESAFYFAIGRVFGQRSASQRTGSSRWLR